MTGRSPAQPTIAAIDQSASPAAASISAVFARRGSAAGAGKALREIREARFVGDDGELRTRATGDLCQSLHVGRGRHSDDLEPVGWRSMRSSVDVPIEPVAPRMAILRRHVSPNSCASGREHSHGDQPVETVEHAAVARAARCR